MKERPKKLIVKTISLQSERMVTVEQPQAELIAEEMPLPVEEEKAPEPKIEEKKKPEIKKPEVKKEEKPKPKAPPKETKKKTPVQAEKKKPPAPKKSAPPKPKSTPQKKTASQNSESKKPKATKPDTQKQAQQEAERARAAAEKKKQEKTAALLSDALSFLNQYDAIQSEKSTIQKNVSSLSSEAPSQVTVQAASITPTIESDGDEFSGGERTYYDELIHRLKLALRLPDHGSVKVKLTLSSDGKVVRVSIVSSKSSKNKSYIEKTLPTLSFPKFGSNFSGQKEQTFRLNLCNELRY
jgi:outer membrane biosynthesis protein TonB